MIESFGTTVSGETVQAILLRADGVSARILTYGAILQDFRLEGLPYSLTLGSDNLADYEDALRYHGALIDPVANRISGAKAVIGGKECVFGPNQDGRITLHSGEAGLHRKHWTIADHGPAHATLAVHLADGEGGFPGARRITARYELLPGATLRLTLSAQTTALTPMNLAIHNYWNLDGSDSWAGHDLHIAAAHYLPVDADIVPTGEISKVAGTVFDFRAERRLLPGNPPLDTNFCLSDQRVALRDVLWLKGTSGVRMTLATTEPGVQVFDNRPEYRGLAIEPQFWPDAMARPDFPDILLAPGTPWEQIDEWRFSKR